MIKWAENDKAIVYFDDTPHVSIRYILPSMSDYEIDSIKKFPFINKKALIVRLVDKVKDRTYQFSIPKGYCYDGATIPRIFWRVIGAPTDNTFLIPALVHDCMCEHHEYVMNDREFSTEVFNVLLEASKVNKLKRFFMKHSVNFFQRFCEWDDDKKSQTVS